MPPPDKLPVQVRCGCRSLCLVFLVFFGISFFFFYLLIRCLPMCQPTRKLFLTNCRSAVYSDRFRTCRLSRYNQKDGMRIIYDADYDYYENLMCKCCS